MRIHRFLARFRQSLLWSSLGLRKPTRSVHRSLKRKWGGIPLRLEWLEERLAPTSDLWTGAAGTLNWTDANNWSTKAVPTSTDDVTINQPISGPIIINISNAANQNIHSLTDTTASLSITGGSLSIAANSSVSQGLTLSKGTLTANQQLSVTGTFMQSGGTLTGSGTVTVAGQTSWLGGTMSGTGTTVAKGGLAIDTTSGSLLLDARTLKNTGSATVKGSAAIDVGDGAVIDNQNGATFAFQSDAGINASSSSSNGTFSNEGVVLKSAGTGTTTITVTFNNKGSVDAKSGIVKLDGGGNSTGGKFIVEAGTTIEFSGFIHGANYTMDAASSISGAGTIVAQFPDPNHEVSNDPNSIIEIGANQTPPVLDHNVQLSFLNTWFKNGGLNGVYGAPIDEARPGTDNVISQRFSGGLMYDSPSTGLLPVRYDLPANAQSLFSPNPQAYAADRHRLLSEFFFNGFIAQHFVPNDPGNQNKSSISFSDQTKDMGNALLTFSQEATILQSGGFDPTPAENVVKIILNAFSQLNNGIAVTDLYNLNDSGLVLRDYVDYNGPEGNLPGVTDTAVVDPKYRQGIPRTWSISSDYHDSRLARDSHTFGSTGQTSDNPPQPIIPYISVVGGLDQITYMLNGLWAVTRYSTNSDNINQAKAQVEQLMHFLINNHYIIPQIPFTDGSGSIALPDGRGVNMTLAAGFLSEMADAATGNGYFLRLDNDVDLVDIPKSWVTDSIKASLDALVASALGGLGTIAVGAYHAVYGSDPVTDFINNQVDSALASVPDPIPVLVPVSIFQAVVLAAPEFLPSLVDLYYDNTISLADFLPAGVQEAFQGLKFDVPTGVKTKIVYHGLESSIEATVTTKTVGLASLLGEIKVTLPGKPKGSSFSRHLVLLQMAYDPTFIADARLNQVALSPSRPDLPDRDSCDVWVALLRPAIQGVSPPSYDVTHEADQLASTAPISGPLNTNNSAEGWQTKDRFETGAADEKKPSDPVKQFNGIDFLSLETLINSDGKYPVVTGTTRVPSVQMVPNAVDPTLKDLQVYGSGQIKAITLVSRGPGVEVFFDGTSQGVFSPTGDVWVHGGTGDKTITVDGDLGLPTHLFGDTGNDAFVLKDGAGNDVAIQGGSGTCTLVGDNINTTWTIDGSNRGHLDNGASFMGIANLVGGSQKDDFIFGSGGTLSGDIDGGDGVNALDFFDVSGLDATLTEEGQMKGFDGTASGQGTLGGTFSNISLIFGSFDQAANKLTGLDGDATWTITNVLSQYTLNADNRTLFFAYFGELDGGASVDTFNIQSTGSDLHVDGKGGINSFNISSTGGIGGPGDVNSIAGLLTITGDGSDNVSVDDRATTEAKTWTLTGTTLSTQDVGLGPIDYSGIANLNISLGSGGNSVEVTSTAAGTTTTLNSGTGTNTINVGSNEPAINGNLVPIQGPLIVQSIGTDTLNVDDSSMQGPKTGTLTPTSLLGLGIGAQGIAFSGLTTLNLSMGPIALPSASDTFNITEVDVYSLVTGPTYALATQMPAGRLTVAGNIASVHVDTGTPGSFAGPIATVTLYEGYSPWSLQEIYTPPIITNPSPPGDPPSSTSNPTPPSSNISSDGHAPSRTSGSSGNGGSTPNGASGGTSTAPSGDTLPSGTGQPVNTVSAPVNVPSTSTVGISSAVGAGAVPTAFVASAGGSPPAASPSPPSTPQPSFFSLFYDLFEMELNLVELELSWLRALDNLRGLPFP